MVTSWKHKTNIFHQKLQNSFLLIHIFTSVDMFSFDSLNQSNCCLRGLYITWKFWSPTKSCINKALLTESYKYTNQNKICSLFILISCYSFHLGFSLCKYLYSYRYAWNCNPTRNACSYQCLVAFIYELFYSSSAGR